jgi:hypothetical protein
MTNRTLAEVAESVQTEENARFNYIEVSRNGKNNYRFTLIKHTQPI